MIKTTKTDELDLNTDGNLDLDKVNAFLQQLQNDYDKNGDNEEVEENGKE